VSDNNPAPGGISLVGALGLLFLGLKLAHVISWSWWLVTLPFWAAAALFVAGALMILAVAGVTEGAKAVARRRQIAQARAYADRNTGRRVSISQRRDHR
jgi:membrane protein implicated in regulation of membrane protease activity